MAQPVERSYCSIIAQNFPSSTQDDYQLDLELTVTELCREVFAEQYNADAQKKENDALTLKNSNLTCFIPGEAYPLKDLLNKNLISTQQRLQAFKIPLLSLKSLKKPFKKIELLIPYCAEFARVIFNEKNEIESFVKKHQIKDYRPDILFPRLLPKKYRLPSSDLETIKNSFKERRKDINWLKNMYAISIMGGELFPESHSLFPRINELLKKMTILMPSQALNELEHIENDLLSGL